MIAEFVKEKLPGYLDILEKLVTGKGFAIGSSVSVTRSFLNMFSFLNDYKEEGAHAENTRPCDIVCACYTYKQLASTNQAYYLSTNMHSIKILKKYFIPLRALVGRRGGLVAERRQNVSI